MLVMRLILNSDSGRRVTKLMKKQRLKGDAAEYIPGYENELSEVIRMRLRELAGEEKARVARVKREKLAIRLRRAPRTYPSFAVRWRSRGVLRTARPLTVSHWWPPRVPRCGASAPAPPSAL